MKARSVALIGVLTVAVTAGYDKLQPTSPQASTRTLAELDAALKSLDGKVAELNTAVKKIEAGPGRWVLWRSTILLDQNQVMLPYFPQEGFGDKPSCITAAKQFVAQALGAGHAISTELSYQATDQRGYRTVYTYVCLPETVDPRQSPIRQ